MVLLKRRATELLREPSRAAAGRPCARAGAADSRSFPPMPTGMFPPLQHNGSHSSAPCWERRPGFDLLCPRIVSCPALVKQPERRLRV